MNEVQGTIQKLLTESGPSEKFDMLTAVPYPSRNFL